MSLTASYVANLQALLTGTSNSLVPVQAPINSPKLINWALGSGTGADQANQIYAAQLSLAASASTTLDVNAFGAVKDAVGGTFNITKVKKLLVQMLGNPVVGTLTSAVIHSATGGTGYVVGDVLTIAGGTGTASAQVTVSTLGASNSVATVAVLAAGNYYTNPTTSNNTVTGGNGTGCGLDLTMGSTQNLATSQFTEADYIDIGGAASNQWTAPFAGSGAPTTAKVRLFSGTLTNPGYFDLAEGGSAGYAVTASTACNLKFTAGANGAAVYFNVFIIGC